MVVSMRTGARRQHLRTMYVHSMVLKCLPLKHRGDYTHTNNAGYSNGSSLPVEGLEIIVYARMLVFVKMLHSTTYMYICTCTSDHHHITCIWILQVMGGDIAYRSLIKTRQ